MSAAVYISLTQPARMVQAVENVKGQPVPRLVHLATWSHGQRCALPSQQLAGHVRRYVFHPLFHPNSIGSVWQYDPQTGEYYLHCFAVEQPDLNWENPAVVSAVHDLMRFWLDKGVNGFRCDVINFISKAPGYPDAPVTEPGAPFQDASALFANGPRLHEHLNGVGKLLESYDAFSVGEMPFAKDEKEVLRVVSPQSRELNMIFQFDV